MSVTQCRHEANALFSPDNCIIIATCILSHIAWAETRLSSVHKFVNACILACVPGL